MQILFQYKVRNDPLTIAQIMAAASEEDEDIHMAVQTPLPARGLTKEEETPALLPATKGWSGMKIWSLHD